MLKAALFFNENSLKRKYFQCCEDTLPGNNKTVIGKYSPLIDFPKKNRQTYKFRLK